VALNFPSNPTVGQVHSDTDSGFSYEWDGVVWKSFTTASASNIKRIDDISSSFNGILTSFALTSNSSTVTPTNNQSLVVNLGGVIQDPTDDYTITNNNIVFSTAPVSGISFSAILLGTSYSAVSQTSEYASVAGIATYASNAGISTYASTAGIATYASTAGISTVAENLTNSPNIIVGSVTADSVSIGSSIQMGNIGIITAKAFHGDGSQLDGVTVNTSFLVSGRVSNTTILLSSGSFTIEGRSGNININA
jgi:hypothetical protein